MIKANKAITTTIEELFQHRPFTKRPSYLAQPKIYGVRGRWCSDEQKLYTRQGNEITSVPHIISAIKEHPLRWYDFEGELYSELINFEELQGIIRKELNKADNRFLRRLHDARVLSIHLHIFDLISHKMRCSDRVNVLMENTKNSEYIFTLPHWLICNESEAQEFYNQCIDEGFEGIVLREVRSLYSDKRSLLRIKPINELNCIYCGWKGEDTLKLTTPNNIEFYCSGMSSRSRDIIYTKFQRGDIIPILHDSFSSRGVPTFARVNNDRVTALGFSKPR